MSEIQLMLRHCKRGNEIKLNLQNKQISLLPIDIYQLTQLEVLDLSNNKLNSLDSKISQLQNLKVLNLQNNNISNLPQQLLNLKNLQVLNVSNNPLNSQFEKLLQTENQMGQQLKICLNNCFNICLQDKNQLGQEKKKLSLLEQQLEKLQFNNNKQQTSSFYISPQTETVQEIDFKELEINESISQGGFSIVHVGMYRGCQVAIKKIFNPNITTELLDELNNEINMLAQLRHPNLILLMGIVSKQPNLCIVTDYIQEGDLYQQLHKRKKEISKENKNFIIKQIANTFNYLHQSQVVHRDLKSYNVLVDNSFKIKICDFGLARKYSDLNQGNSKFSGTPTYMAPELYQKKSYDEKVDVFAFGTLVWEIFTSSIPFDGLEPSDIMQRVLKDEQLPLKPGINQQLLKFVSKCRHSDPKIRPSFIQIVQELENIL
ncbi:serine-threonine protein kinase, putative [Ichthyophthirius multifiliis]|uniref:Serine-threonine protein kinase, putative n=1 Tax=Ichthyophthirius multifiliis TaxID=5932 RepID=G0QXL9_ICHMU|nr:serine-threonine protein kinase, putative [Ichthyophthirius multifiliis]EGR30049.1 serine-threonine protein kinase, putative [Ichthyophthirius multifiliis]|eukprot:XP_004031285.1 serine-threonine protein kinase, putative [Ichthyophthirius multifiliis]